VVADHVDAERFIVELGADMIRSSQTVDDVERELREIGDVMGLVDFDVMALPTAIMLESRGAGADGSRLRSIREPGLRLDQVDAVDGLARRARLGTVEARQGLAELDEICRRPAPFGRVVRSLGLGVLASGFSLALQPSVAGLVLSFVLGTAVGVFLALDLPGFAAITPTLMTFVVSLIVFALFDVYDGDNPIRFLIPPVLIFLPGAKLTLGTIELAEGAIVSGSSRLLSGVVDLLLLAVAIVAAAAIIEVPQRDLLDQPAPQLGAWSLAPALVLIALGYRFHSSAPRRAVPWILLVLTVALAGELAASLVFSPPVAAFFGAAAMTPVVTAIASRPQGPRAMVLFLPGFYLLVPGAAGLIDVTGSVAPGFSTNSLQTTMITVVAIALGVLFATSLVDAVRALHSERTGRDPRDA
jgi:uncharacterized membrane protein YjjP (DUF1212 family)/uncharacterized membrane protein YjjB (DUF3815 family)